MCLQLKVARQIATVEIELDVFDVHGEGELMVMMERAAVGIAD